MLLVDHDTESAHAALVEISRGNVGLLTTFTDEFVKSLGSVATVGTHNVVGTHHEVKHADLIEPRSFQTNFQNR